ncbi:MAG TPA: hypothetical protein VGL24_01005 [Chthoniobacterales bacterium]|jgi:hypothetical protein
MQKRSNVLHPSAFIFLTLLLSLTTVRAGFVETFDNGSNNGDWHLTVNPAMLETDGGNPGAYLRASADAAVPTWYVPYLTENTYFLGNYAGKQVGTLAFDVDIFSGVQVPDRAVTLDLNTTLGTGDFSKGVDAYYIGTDISQLPVGWHTYEFPINAASATIPPGWVVTKGNGRPGTDADWQALMHDVETLGVELGEPGFFYPFGIWDIGLDNPRITKLIRP